MSTEKFRQMREKYIKKHGYTITIPGFEDIFHIPVEKPLTPQEEKWWRKKDYSHFTPERLDEIRYIKKRRREKFLSMLSSPIPDILQARGSIIGSIDDAEDALSTAVGIGAIALRFLPRKIADIVSGPLGWAATTADILDLMNELITPERRLINSKRDLEKITEDAPKANMAKLTKEERIRRHGTFIGLLAEGLQVTDNVFGVGVSLGAVMNLPLDITSGLARMAQGKEVHYKLPWPDLHHWERLGMAMLKGMAVLNGYEHHTDPDLEIRNYVCAYMQHQIVADLWQNTDPLEQIGDIRGIKVEAPRPKKLLTLEVIKEAGDDPNAGIAWPQTGERWSEINDLMSATAPIATRNLNHYSELTRHDLKGLVGAKIATDASLYALENVAGKGSVWVDHTAASKAAFGLMTMGLKMPPDITQEQKRGLVEYLNDLDRRKQSPEVKDICNYAKRVLGFQFVHHVG